MNGFTHGKKFCTVALTCKEGGGFTYIHIHMYFIVTSPMGLFRNNYLNY